MAYDARTIANEIWYLARRDGLALTNMQLQKIPYFAHAWSWVIYDRPLINELPRAFPYGPVYQSLYRSLRKYGSQPILAPIPDAPNETVTHEDKELIDSIWSVYRQYTAYQLSAMTHKKGSPWSKARLKGSRAEISDEDTRSYYCHLDMGRHHGAS